MHGGPETEDFDAIPAKARRPKQKVKGKRRYKKRAKKLRKSRQPA